MRVCGRVIMVRGRRWQGLHVGRGGGWDWGYLWEKGFLNYLLLCRTWGYVYLWRYHSFAVFYYSSYTRRCGNVLVYWVSDPSYLFAISQLFLRLIHMCPVSSICWANFEVSLLFLRVWICSRYRSLNIHPLCPSYISGHSLHFSWYTPDCLYISVTGLPRF
jgi:hypothetical protein